MLSADPAFLGHPQKLNPEQLLLVSASSCQLLSFLAIAARARIRILEYDDRAEAEMPEDVKPMRLTKLTLRPRIVVGPGVKEERVLKFTELAHRQCYISNSLGTEVALEPTVEIRQSEITDWQNRTSHQETLGVVEVALESLSKRPEAHQLLQPQ
jgi:organic hydroperoxide reductase OsmC/OhrA